MDISSKDVRHRVHTAVATVDDLKGVAIGAVKRQLGLSDDAVASSEATVGADGSIAVEVVELVLEAPKPDAPVPPQPGLSIPTR